MTNLDCTVYGCYYNKDNSCSRGNIQVGGKEAIKSSETLCRSFEQRSNKETNQARNAASCSASRPTDVACDAVKCRYNQDQRCKATHIRIAGLHAVTSGETQCGSYEAK